MERPTEKPICAVFDAQTANLAAIRRFVMTAAEEAGFSREVAGAMILAVDEAATNVIVHGYQSGPGTIEVELKVDGDALQVRLRDDAPAFNPISVPAPNLDIPLHLRPPGGLGVHLIRQFVDHMSYRRTDRGQNELTLEILAPERGAARACTANADEIGRTT